jgi:hypothetical protein
MSLNRQLVKDLEKVSVFSHDNFSGALLHVLCSRTDSKTSILLSQFLKCCYRSLSVGVILIKNK